MADGAHTRQMSLQDMVQQLKEMNAQQAELKGEIGDMFGDMFSEMKDDLLGILKQALKLPEQTTVTNPNPSVETVTNPEPLVETLKNSGPFIEPLRRASVLQVPDSFCDVLLVHKLDSHVKEVEEFSHESTNGNDKIVAHQLFDQMPNEYQKDLTVISNKEVLSFSHKDARVWEPGGLSNKMDFWDWPKGESKPHKKKSHQIETFEVLSHLEPSRRCHKESLDFVDKRMCNELAWDEDGDSIITISAKFRERYEEHQFESVSLKQTHDSVENYFGSFEYALTRSPLLHTSTDQYRAPFNPYQICSDQCHYKREFGNYTEPGIGFDRECEEIEDDELKDKQPEEDVETLVMSENEKSLECVDDESSVNEKLIEVIAEETAFESMDESGRNVYKERNLNSFLLQEFQILLFHVKESSDTIAPCRNLDTRVLSSHFFAGGITQLSKMVFKSSNVHQNKNQIDQKLSSYWKLLLRLLHPKHINRWRSFYLLVIKSLFKGKEERASFNVAVTSCSSYVKVLELIKDKASRKSKLCKNWWFKYKLNTWPSEALHFWGKGKSEKLQRASKHMICELIQMSWDMSIFGKSRTRLLCKMRIVHGLEDLRQLTRAGIRFHLKHKWRSKLESNKLRRTWTSYSRYDSSSCVLQQEDNYVMVLFPVAGRTADISTDELRSVCKFLFGTFVLNLIAEQVRDWSFFGLLLQWKWHPPPQATSEFHQAHNDKPVFHL